MRALITIDDSCVVCGQRNPHGLRIRFRADGADGVVAHWHAEPEWQGYRGIVHGGIVSTLLDEAMSKAVAASGVHALTAELRVRYRHTVTIGATVELRGWVVRRHKRLIETEAHICALSGQELAHAWASFLVPLR